MLLHRPFLAVTFVCALASFSNAGFTSAITPPFRGGPCTHVGGWEVFTQASLLPNAADVAGSTASSASITQLLAGAILTSSGNIYDPFQATSFELTDTANADVQEVVFQTSTFGNPRDYTSFALRYVDGLGAPVELPPSDFQVLVQTSGHEELYVRWSLASIADEILTYTLVFEASASSMSFDAAWLDVRELCPPGAAFCFGDGSLTDHTTPCPCGNTGAPGHGCAHSFDAAGAQLAASGTVANDDVVLASSSTPVSSFTLFMQHDALGDTAFHDGTLCAGGSLIRLRGRAAVSGAATFPNSAFANDATLTLSQRGQVTPGQGVSRYYAAWYRNASSTFCPPATANVTNGWRIDW